MEITFEKVREKFTSLIEKSVSREQASEWASTIRKQIEANEILIIPKECKNLGWEILIYLE